MFYNVDKFLGLNQAKLDSVQSSKVAEVLPQASDDAIAADTISLWGLFLSIFGYIAYAVYKDLNHDWPTIAEMRAARLAQTDILRVTPNDVPTRMSSPTTVRDFPGLRFEADSESVDSSKENVTPQSGLGSIDSPTDALTSENVTFMDAHPGFRQNIESSMDEVRGAALNDDASLDTFFSRPLKIASYDWNAAVSPGGLLYARFNPWQLYFENLRVINRISNYKLLSAKLCVKFTINGNAFHYGRAICSYNPLPSFDTMTVDRAFVDADVVAASQRPHVYLDPTNSQGGELCLPFFTPRNLLDITSMDWREMGEIVIHSMQGLKHANGAVDQVTVNVFAWAEDVRFAIPTGTEPGAIAPQSAKGSMDEHGTRPVSRIAGAVANFASYLIDAPIIGPYARATEIGATAMGAIATLFGYSSPACIDINNYRPLSVANYGVTNMPSDCLKLSVDAKQELTVDPRTVGLGTQDELDINYIAKHESWFTNFPWAVGTASESLLFNVVVDPGVHNNFSDEIHMTAPCFAVQPFKYWRGTLRYRFQVVCSKYHKGRMKLVYDPSGNTTGAAEYNTAYTTIVDISDTSDFSIDVGWGQREPYREHWSVTATNALMFNTTPLASYTSPISPVGNGTLSVYVVNELTVPNSSIDNDIEINVFISALDDFEVASPDFNLLERLRVTKSGLVTSPQAEEGGLTEEVMKTDSAPQLTSAVSEMANKISTSQDPTNLVYFGERVKSMRQMLKRFSRHRFLPGDEGGVKAIVYNNHAFPYYAGYTSSGAVNRNVFALPSGTYAYGWTTFMNYVTCAYGGWRGGIRRLLDMSNLQMALPNGAIYVTRAPDGVDMNWSSTASTNNSWTQFGFVDVYNDVAGQSTFDGSIVQSLTVNPHVCFEIPYARPYRFTPAKRHSVQDTIDPFDTGYEVLIHGFLANNNRSNCMEHVAGAEDFSCFFYLGPPIFYLESSIPVS